MRAALEEKYGLEEDALDVYKKELRTTMDEAAVRMRTVLRCRIGD